MGLANKIISALQQPLHAEYIRLDDDDGISGFVVSSQFERMSPLDRQQLIDSTLRSAPEPLSQEEQRQVLMIAGLTPLEYESVGSRIRIHNVRELEDGSLEVLLHGSYSDAMYVRALLDGQEGMTTTEPEQSPGAIGVLMAFRVKGTDAASLTREQVMRVLQADRYITVMQNV